MERDLSEKHRYNSKNESLVKPLNFLERAFLRAYAFGGQLRNPIDYGLSLRGNARLWHVTSDISKGQAGTTSLAIERRETFPNYTTLAIGTENIPEQQPFMVASNHYNRGPEKGEWQTPAIAQILDDLLNNSCRFRVIVSTDKELWKPLHIIPGAKNIYKKIVNHVYSNAASTFDFLQVGQGREIIKILKDKTDVLGVFPTEAEFKVTQGKKEAGDLFEKGGRYGWTILPVGAYHDRKRKVFIVNIGKPIICKKDPNDQKSEQKTVNTVMEKVAALLPPEMRGIYG